MRRYPGYADRLRSDLHLALMTQLNKEGIAFRSLTEQIDTTSSGEGRGAGRVRVGDDPGTDPIDSWRSTHRNEEGQRSPSSLFLASSQTPLLRRRWH